MANGFQGKEGQSVPAMDDDWLTQISTRYIELYETVTGQRFQPAPAADSDARVAAAILAYLQTNE